MYTLLTHPSYLRQTTLETIRTLGTKARAVVGKEAELLLFAVSVCPQAATLSIYLVGKVAYFGLGLIVAVY